MKKSSFIILAVILAMVSAPNAQAQSWKSVLSGTLQKITGNSTASDLVESLIGTAKLTQASLKGTWTYSQPAVAFESENALNKAGGSLIVGNVEKKLGTYLTKVGIKPGALVFTFNADSTFTCTHNNRTTKGRYLVSESNVTLTLSTGAHITANAKLSGSLLDLTFKADKLLQLLQSLESVASVSTTLATISKVANSYSGMQVGLQFKK